MSTPTECVFDLDPPRRAGLDDVGGGAKQDDQAYPPNPETMATGADLNQWANLLVRYGEVAPVAIMSIHWMLGTPSIASLAHVKGPTFTASDFTVGSTGTGHFTVTWGATDFPSRTVDPEAHVTGAGVGAIGFATASATAHGAIVDMFDSAGNRTNKQFNLYIYGD